MDELKRQYLEAMGIQAWVTRDVSETPAHETPDTAANPVQAAAPVQQTEAQVTPAAGEGDRPLDWDALQQAVAHCEHCAELVANRSRTVFGVGNRNVACMVIGEAPGADEDRQGEPFVGRAGQLLNNMLLAIGLKREQVYIANILKCRPPNNRDPRPEEAAACREFLERQIELIQPKLILVVGRIAAQNLLNSDQPLGRLRGRPHTLAQSNTPVVVTYHPAYLLRSPGEKRKAWQDLKQVRAMLLEQTE